MYASLPAPFDPLSHCIWLLFGPNKVPASTAIFRKRKIYTKLRNEISHKSLEFGYLESNDRVVLGELDLG